MDSQLVGPWFAFVTYRKYNTNMNSERTIPVTEARGQLAELVNLVAYSGDHVTLTRHGRPMAVLVSVADAQRLQEVEVQDIEHTQVHSLPIPTTETLEELGHRHDIAARTTPGDPTDPRSNNRGTC